ncbi:MAG: hypothetical protein LC778_15040, partial [Acidobacteria bacterium]|nr:hypothetical protein [Acidobacteriota bacterium]
MKGCESPLVSRVCQVLDTIYVGSTLLGADGEFVSRDYQKSELEDADITYIDVSGQSPPLTYPEGYFALANPEQQIAAMQNMNSDFSTMPSFDSGFPSNPTISNGTDLMATPQVTPTPNTNAVTGTIPDSPFDFGGNPTITKRGKSPRIYTPKKPKIKNDSPVKLPSDDELAEGNDKEKKEKKDEKQPDATQTTVDSEAVTDFRPNKKPLEDFAQEVLIKRSEKESKLDLTKSFKVEMSGVLTEDGKLDDKKSRYLKAEGDEEMVNVAKRAIESISDSGLFYYLKTLGVEKVNFTLVQDDKQMYAVITSSQKDENKAKSISSGFNTLLSIAKTTIKEEELKTLINSAKVEPQGKNFVLNFKIDKPVAQEMINKKLNEAQAKKNQPNSTAQNDNTNQKTVK